MSSETNKSLSRREFVTRTCKCAASIAAAGGICYWAYDKEGPAAHKQKEELVKTLRKKGWTQERIARVVGIPQQTISDLQKGSITDFGNTSLPDLRYKISKEDEQVIFNRYQGGETQAQIAADYGISRQRADQRK